MELVTAHVCVLMNDFRCESFDRRVDYDMRNEARVGRNEIERVHDICRQMPVSIT